MSLVCCCRGHEGGGTGITIVEVRNAILSDHCTAHTAFVWGGSWGFDREVLENEMRKEGVRGGGVASVCWRCLREEEDAPLWFCKDEG